jgi:hypothetical protein
MTPMPNHTRPDLRYVRRAEVAAVNEIARGSQQRTMMAMSHRIAFSLSVSVPRNSST